MNAINMSRNQAQNEGTQARGPQTGENGVLASLAEQYTHTHISPNSNRQDIIPSLRTCMRAGDTDASNWTCDRCAPQAKAARNIAWGLLGVPAVPAANRAKKTTQAILPLACVWLCNSPRIGHATKDSLRVSTRCRMSRGCIG